MSTLTVFHKAEIAKVFPGYQEGNPFFGKVHKIDSQGADDKPFKIHYDDGDREWVRLEELSTILVDADLRAQAKYILQHGLPADAKDNAGPAPKAAPPSSKKRKQPEADAAAAAPANAKRTKSAVAAAAAGAAPAADGANPPARKGAKQPAAAAGAAAEPGAGSGGGRAARASGKAAAAAGGAPGSGAAGTDMMGEVLKGTTEAAGQLLDGSTFLRAPYKGSGASGLPRMSAAVVAGNMTSFTFYAKTHTANVNGVQAIDYRTQTQDVLTALDMQMGTRTNLTKKSLTRVRVYLRSIDGLPAFTEVWNSWVDHTCLPVLTILQGNGPFSNSGVLLEAEAYSNIPAHA